MKNPFQNFLLLPALTVIVFLGIFMSTTISAAPLTTTTILTSEIKKTDSMLDIQKIFEQVSSHGNGNRRVWGLFDIDMVLIESDHPAFQMLNLIKHKPIFKDLFANLTALEKNIALNLIVQTTNPILVEKVTPKIIAALQSTIKNGKNPNLILMAFTASFSGALEKETDLCALRNQQLSQFGMSFSDSTIHFKPIKLTALQHSRQFYPEFKNGILCSNGNPKGETLVEFIKQVNYLPDTFIFVDDREDNVLDVQAALAKHHPHIHYIGIVYLGAMNQTTPAIDEATFKQAWAEKIEAAKKIVAINGFK